MVERYFDGKSTRPETASQVIGAFLMMHGVAPWEAEELIRWLSEDDFVIERRAVSGTIGK